MRKLDLHGVKHSEVHRKVEDFIYMNQYEFPLEIICGNSGRMIALVKEVAHKIGVEIHMYRYGVVVARRWL